MYYFLFSLIVLVASTLGALAGIGGGVIIRPALDAFNYYQEPLIVNFLSAFCVLAVALTSVIKRIITKQKIDNYLTSIFLGIGAATGGVAGNYLFKLVKSASNKNWLVIIQSIVLILFLIFVIIYMLVLKKKGIQFKIKNWAIKILIGLFLGVASSFLGIGGGPINVAVLCFFFSMTMKESSINSLIIIIFSQTSKIIVALIDGSLLSPSTNMDWWMLLCLVPIAVGGSLLGSWLNKKLSEKTILYVYIISVFVIIGINIYNIITNSLALGGII